MARVLPLQSQLVSSTAPAGSLHPHPRSLPASTSARPSAAPRRLPRLQVNAAAATGGNRKGSGRNQIKPPGVAVTVPGIETAEPETHSSSSGGLDSVFRDYAEGYRSLTVDCETEGWVTDVVGTIPPELSGTLLRNGPALFKRDGFDKVFLDGDGMISSLAIKDGKAYFRNKFVRTPGFQVEEESGKFSMISIFSEKDPRPNLTGNPAWYHRLVDDIFRGPPQPKNNAAYNAWYWGKSLVAVDFGRPFGLDPNTLETIGEVDAFSSDKFTAHSRILEEPDGSGQRLITFSPYVDWAKQLTTVTFAEWDVEGKKVKEFVFEFPAAYFHDLIVTDNWYILFDCPIKMDMGKTFFGYPMEKNSLGDTISEDRSRPPIFRLFPRREGLGGPKVVPVKGMHCYAYHHINGFDTPDGKSVIFDTCTWDRFTLYFKDIVEPDGKNFFPRTKTTRFTIDLEENVATPKSLNWRPSEYPTVAPASAGRPYKYSYMSTSAVFDGDVNGPMHQLTKLTLASTEPDCHACVEENWFPGNRRFIGEPLFVARPGATSEDDGWVVVLVHDSSYKGTELAILDAKDVTKGPIALLHLPTYVPMGVHGSWTDDYILGPQPATATL